MYQPKTESPCAVNGLFLHPGLYRAQLSCKIGRDAIEGKITPPDGATPMEWAMFNLLHAVEEIAIAMMPNDQAQLRSVANKPDRLVGRSVTKGERR
jgi:hypothetical protein